MKSKWTRRPGWLLIALAIASMLAPAAQAADEQPPRLSVFVPVPTGTAWARLRPGLGRERNVVALLPVPPFGARAAWSADGLQGIAWFDPENQAFAEGRPDIPPPGVRARLFRVNLAQRRPVELSLPTDGTLQDVGFDRHGALIALTLGAPIERRDREGRPTATYAGRTYLGEAASEGIPVLAHAFRLDARGRWLHLETVPTTTGWDYGLGVKALAISATLGTRSATLRDEHPAHEDVHEAATLARLKALPGAPAPREGDGWARLLLPRPAAYAWMITGEFTYPTGRVALTTPDGHLAWAPGLPWGARDTIGVEARGPWLLLTGAGAGTQPRLYDRRNASLVFSSDEARDVTFWPDAP